MEEDLDMSHKTPMAEVENQMEAQESNKKTKPEKQWENLANKDGDELQKNRTKQVS